MKWAAPVSVSSVARWLVVALASIPIVLVKLYLQYLVQAEYAFHVTNLAWIVGPLTVIGDRDVRIVQGKKGSDSPIKLYFDDGNNTNNSTVRQPGKAVIDPKHTDHPDVKQNSNAVDEVIKAQGGAPPKPH